MPLEPNVQKVIDDEDEAGLDRLEGYDELCAAGERDQVRIGRVPAHCGAARQDGSGLWSAGQERDTAALLRHRKGFDRIHGGSQPLQARAILPGTRIPIYHPDRIRETKPDYVVILPWNLKDEIMKQLEFIREWGGRFVVPIPKVTVY